VKPQRIGWDLREVLAPDDIAISEVAAFVPGIGSGIRGRANRAPLRITRRPTLHASE
jgi:hypothetical protein